MNRKHEIYKYIFWDLVAAFVVWVLFMIFRRVVNDGVMFQNITIFVPNYNYYRTLALFPVLAIFIHYLTGYYVNPIKESRFAEIFTTLISTVIISIIIFFALLLDDIVVSYKYYYYSLLVLIILMFSATLFVRLIHSGIIRKKFLSKRWTSNTLIVGTGENAAKLAEEIERLQKYNTVTGFLRVAPASPVVDEKLILGSLQDAGRVIEEYDVQEVVVALDDSSDVKIFDIINMLFFYNVEIHFTPRLYEILTGKVRYQRHGVRPLVSVTNPTMSDWELCVKRTFDITSSVAALIVLSPLLLYYAIAIKLDSKGPVLYRQSRVGMHGKEFNMLKLRTMYQNSEKGVPKLSSPDDRRITGVGRTLRKYRIDEVPQFINVIKGDMSIVGPRPERKYYVDKIIEQAPYYCLIYRLRPGLTSWGPIKIGYSDSIEKMIERLNYDIVYLENMNLMTDAKIIISTLEILFKGKGM